MPANRKSPIPNPKSPSPRALGYRMPAEWERHTATWLSWPRPDGISFPDRYHEILPTLGEMVRTLALHETVNINCRTPEVEAIARKTIGTTDNVRFHPIPSYEPWCRDHGPMFVVAAAPSEPTQSNIAIVDWNYNAWGGKYPPYDDDDAVPQRVAELLGLPLFQPGIVMEGGSIDVNGAGAVLTTEACLLNPNRNPDLARDQIEHYLKEYLGVAHVLWLGDGIVGDDTDGHIDDLTRFVNPTTVVTVVERDRHDENYPMLQANLDRLRDFTDQDGRPLAVIELPMPRRIEHDGQRLPASYANFYVANDVVLLPTYADRPHDQQARDILQQCFPGRTIAAIDSTRLIWGLGSFHCLTQQQPTV